MFICCIAFATFCLFHPALTKMLSLTPLICLRLGQRLCIFNGGWWSAESGKTSSPVGVLRAVGKGSMPDAQSSGLRCGSSCLPLYVFHNKQNKLGFLWDLRLVHSWMAVVHCWVHIRRCSYTSTMICQRELSTECSINCANFYKRWNAWTFCTCMSGFIIFLQSEISHKLLCVAPQQSFPQADRKCQQPHGSCQMRNTS